MRYNVLQIFLAALCLGLFSGCAEEDFDAPYSPESFEEGFVTEMPLTVTINGMSGEVTPFSRAAEPSDTPPNDPTDEENKIDNLWVVQYDAASGRQLTKPRYYIITDQSELQDLKVMLKPDENGSQSRIYVIANTNDEKWLIDKDILTSDKLCNLSLPEPNPIRYGVDEVLIPMEGKSDAVSVSQQSIEIPVTRMYAKVKIKMVKTPKNLTLKSIEIKGIPWYCRIASQSKSDDETPGVYPEGTTYITRSFTADAEKEDETWYTIYVPENLVGEKDDAVNMSVGTVESDKAPANALHLIVSAVNKDDNGAENVFSYHLYPGSNKTNNFNIKRNNVYRVTVDLSKTEEQHVPSSNCFVAKPNELLYFEPYFRVETGGGYKIEDYLDPTDPTGKKVIDHMKIIWQTYDCIGDNTKGDLVWIDNKSIIGGDPKHIKIYIKTLKKGNALIGGYNKDGEIIWSWHIWCTDSEPDNVGNAVVYSTYRWDKDGIYPDQPRVPGYAVMSCNLGAMAFTPKDDSKDGKLATFGLLYQWGRKDPFPNMRPRNLPLYGFYPYCDNTNAASWTSANIDIYDNSNKHVAMTTSGAVMDSKAEELFRSYMTTSISTQTADGGIRYSIANPTVFIAAAKKLNVDGSIGNINNAKEFYYNDGDWLPGHDDKLWGAYPPGKPYDSYAIESNKRIWDIYGDKKSVFDPCPSGWRVAPGDLWLGLTYNGKSLHANGSMPMEEFFSKGNFSIESNSNQKAAADCGYYMHMQQWKSGPTSFFPTQGSRLASGEPMHGGYCGNYHNATADLGNRVNTLHFHADNSGANWEQVNIFEPQYCYHVKAVAGPIRCVRDTK